MPTAAQSARKRTLEVECQVTARLPATRWRVARIESMRVPDIDSDAHAVDDQDIQAAAEVKADIEIGGVVRRR